MWKRSGATALALILALALAPRPAGGDEPERAPGDRAREHRSESAEDNSNAQWSDDATRGRERAEERRPDDAAAEPAERERGRDREEEARRDREEEARRDRNEKPPGSKAGAGSKGGGGGGRSKR